MKLFPPHLLATCFLNAGANAAGINCEGSSLCNASEGGFDKLKNFITDNINGADPNFVYQDGQQVACLGSRDTVCCFPQGGTLKGDLARYFIVELGKHGCTACGSIPMDWPNSNDSGVKGLFTCNYVTNGCGSNLCDGALNPK
ncbi:hypothetical protein FDECE_7975 [Fusarium decemcellulare]|nr:hypothetical protein FDECE_7975 [Fusarium decemcellulare]